MKNFSFENFDHAIQNLEYSIVNLVSSISPWLAPIIPAYLTYTHTKNVLQFNSIIAFIAAITVEFLGLATVSTTLTFWNHNRKYKDPAKVAPFKIALFAFCFYLITVLMINGVLETIPLDTQPSTNIRVTISVLLTVLSVPAAITVAIRSIYSEKIKNIKKFTSPKERNINTLNRNLNSAKKKIAQLQNTHKDAKKLQEQNVELQAQNTELQDAYKKLQKNMVLAQGQIEELQIHETTIQAMNAKYKAAAMYSAEIIPTLAEAANIGKCDPSTISRISKNMNGNKEGNS